MNSGKNNITIDDDDDDSENDSDYNPDEDIIKEDDENEESNDNLKGLSFASKRKVDEIWNSLVDEDKKIYKKHPGVKSVKVDVTKPSKKVKNRLKKTKSILTQIFGNSVANSILAENSLVDSLESKNTTSNESSNDIKCVVKDAVSKVQKKIKIVEKRKFAGQEISVSKSAYGSISATNSNTQSKNHQSQSTSLDMVLDTIKGPKGVSTVAKSSMDWENFKEKEGIEDDLTHAAKNGYLAKKEFLERCDYRNFEQEREVRLKSATINSLITTTK